VELGQERAECRLECALVALRIPVLTPGLLENDVRVARTGRRHVEPSLARSTMSASTKPLNAIGSANQTDRGDPGTECAANGRAAPQSRTAVKSAAAMAAAFEPAPLRTQGCAAGDGQRYRETAGSRQRRDVFHSCFELTNDAGR
jgi:hypothetical protein